MVATRTTALGTSPEIRHLMLTNFSILFALVSLDLDGWEWCCVPDISSETSFSDDVSNLVGRFSFFDTREFEGDLVGENGRVSVSDVGERTSVYENGSSL